MHFEVLIEDQSGKVLLDCVLPRILHVERTGHTFRVHSYKGIGAIPRGLIGKSDPSKRILLDRLPQLLSGYGKSLKGLDAAVVVVVDLDDRDCVQFKTELVEVWKKCSDRPKALFRIASEEVEAWLMADRTAIRTAYPNVRSSAFRHYLQDSVCGTWECLADAIYPGGAAKLKPQGYPEIGRAKSEWAASIAPRINIEANGSRSFQVFRDGLRRLASE